MRLLTSAVPIDRVRRESGNPSYPCLGRKAAQLAVEGCLWQIAGWLVEGTPLRIEVNLLLPKSLAV